MSSLYVEKDSTGRAEAVLQLKNSYGKGTVLAFDAAGLAVNGPATASIPDITAPASISGAWSFAGGALKAALDSSSVYTGLGALRFDDSSGFYSEIGLPGGINFSANRRINLPDASGILALQSATMTMFNGASSTLISSTASSGCSFTDASTSTKKLRVVLSGAVGNNSITLTNTAARNFGLGDLGGNLAVVGDQAPAVSAGRLGKVDTIAATANVATTNLSNSPPSGMYRVEAVLTTDTTDAGAGTLTLTIGYTDSLGATTDTTCHIDLSVYDRKTLSLPLFVASGNITYAVSNGGGAYGTAKWSLHLRVTYLG